MNVRFGTRLIAPKQLNAYFNSSIKMMRSMGLIKGERVILYDHNSVEYAILLMCCWYMGIIPCPVNPKWPIKNAREYASKIGAKHFFAAQEIKRAIAFDARQQLYAPVALPPLNPDQEAVIIATSGSSGEPKPAVLTIGNLLSNAQGSKTVIPFESSDSWLLSLPLYHVSGVSIVMRVIEADATLVVATADNLMDDINRPAVTHVSLVATQLYRLLNQLGSVARLSSLKAILLGGSTIPISLLDESIKSSLPIYISYGLTEMASQVATGKVINPNQPCAKVLPYRLLSIAPDGEILVKGDTLFKGYVIGQRIEKKTDQEGWFHTGDIGQIDVSGCLSVYGRKDNMFITAGENIHPEEIERILLTMPGIKQAIVVPTLDKEYGLVPVAYVETEGTINPEQIIAFCQQFLSTIKIPTQFNTWPVLNDVSIKPNRKFFLDLITKSY